MDSSPARDAIVDALKARPGRPVLVGVDGHSAAGKSTVATELAAVFETAVLESPVFENAVFENAVFETAVLGAAIVAGDDFYRVMDEQGRANLTPAEGADLYYDWQRMDAEALGPLAAGRTASFHPYDWATGQLSDEVRTIEPASVVIVEGLFVSRPELRHHFSVLILVVTDASERRRRQLARADASEAWLSRWDDAERHHLTTVSPPESFDVIVT